MDVASESLVDAEADSATVEMVDCVGDLVLWLDARFGNSTLSCSFILDVVWLAERVGVADSRTLVFAGVLGRGD